MVQGQRVTDTGVDSRPVKLGGKAFGQAYQVGYLNQAEGVEQDIDP